MGGARFSPKHANFVENAGEATTADILELMAEGRRRVHEKFGIVLEPEVQVLGEVEKPAGWELAEGEDFVAPTAKGEWMASPFVADLGRVARTAPRTVIAAPRSVLSRRWVVDACWSWSWPPSPAYMLWFRHSSFVAVDEVDVTGVSFSEPAIRTALTGDGEWE